MSQRDRGGSPDRNPGNGNGGKTKIITSLIIFAFILGSVIASGVTFVLFKQFGLLKTENPLASPTPTPTPLETQTPASTPTPIPTPSETASPTPTLVEASPTPTETPSSSPQQTDSPTPQTSESKLLVKDMVISGDNYIDFIQENILIRGKLYSPIFRLYGDNEKRRRVGFKLDGSQKKLLLEFGQKDLEAGNTNLTYAIKISVDGQEIWSGKCEYGQKSQIISVPLDKPGATSLVIEYSINQPGGFSWNFPSLYFTKAELLY